MTLLRFARPVLPLLAVVFFSGCGDQASVESTEKPSTMFTDTERAELVEASQAAIETYKEGGLYGLIALVSECYESDRSAGLECLAYDFMGWYIDSGMSELNGFPRDEFFTDNKTLSRSAGSTYFDDKELIRVFTTLMQARDEIIEHFQSLESWGSSTDSRDKPTI